MLRLGFPGGNPYSCLENFKDRGDWQATVHEAAKSRSYLNHQVHAQTQTDRQTDTHTHTHTHTVKHLDVVKRKHFGR